MSFLDPKAKDLVVGKQYRLTEIVEDQTVSSGNYYLHSVEQIPENVYPILGFLKSTTQKKPDVFLIQAHAQFGSPTWRRAFRVDGQWELYWPAGGRTWNWSFVRIEKLS